MLVFVCVLCLTVNVFFADIDECVNNTICDSHGFCDNTAGSFRCLCYQGFQAPQDGQGCVGEFLDFFFLPTSLYQEEIKLINHRRDGSKVTGQNDIIISSHRMVCGEVHSDPAASEMVRDVKK